MNNNNRCRENGKDKKSYFVKFSANNFANLGEINDFLRTVNHQKLIPEEALLDNLNK